MNDNRIDELDDEPIDEGVLDGLRMMLSMSVFFRIRHIGERGGPTGVDYQRAVAAIRQLDRDGHWLFEQSPIRGQTAEVFNRTAEACAILSFMPGGFEFAGIRWVSEIPDNAGSDEDD